MSKIFVERRRELPRTVLLLITPRSYRSRAFIEAAQKLDLEVIKAVEMVSHLAEYWNYPLGLDYGDLEKSVEAIGRFSEETPLGAIVPVDDSGTLLAAMASKSLGLPHNSPEAALAAQDKHQMRQLLKAQPVNSPGFELITLTSPSDDHTLQRIANSAAYPCVVKPLSLSGSRGVIRANNPDEFYVAGKRLERLLKTRDPGADSISFLVEDFIPGFEVAMEAILDDGHLIPLALFDKPDPLDGPYFEETIYVTPSRLATEIQEAIFDCVCLSAKAFGLRQGPVHAELRLNEDGPWLIEMAGRSIGGHCSDALRFTSDSLLEELILRQTFGMEFRSLKREEQASGVMMLPIPEAGILKGIDGCEEAESVPLIEKVEITARLNYSLRPLPEGDSYLGFIFARGDSPKEIERALRAAQEELSFKIAPELPVLAL